MTALHAKVAVLGALFGFTVSMVGFADFGELNAMFTFQDTRMLLAFAGGVAVAALGFLLLDPKRPTRTRIHKGVVPGAVLFGAGWAVSGGCPAIPLVQLGAGYLPAIVTLAGVASGMVAYRHLNARYLHIDAGSC
ncbi:MAG: YeeE/YedE family protein, partial [Acidimicrobiaceae bacterium]|nr:YeeE/YedE family protein [Acidimicrobiaceae bacterium]